MLSSLSWLSFNHLRETPFNHLRRGVPNPPEVVLFSRDRKAFECQLLQKIHSRDTGFECQRRGREQSTINVTYSDIRNLFGIKVFIRSSPPSRPPMSPKIFAHRATTTSDFQFLDHTIIFYPVPLIPLKAMQISPHFATSLVPP